MPTLQELISQLLPFVLQQPVPRAQLEERAGQLFNPAFDEQQRESLGDIDLARSRFEENLDRAGGRLGTNRSRFLEDVGTQHSLLRRTGEVTGERQGRERGALQERLATQGLSFGPGLGDLQRNLLSRSHELENLGLQDQVNSLDRRTTRGLADLDFEGGTIRQSRARGLDDFATNRFRTDRNVNRRRSAAIQGFANDPFNLFASVSF